MVKIGQGGNADYSASQADGSDAAASEGTHGTALSYVRRLREGLTSTHPEWILGYAGSFNSETASMEVKTDIFESCAHFLELSADCSKCGRKPGNNLSLLSGRGDGVYSGVNYWSGQEFFEDREPDLVASIYLFDQDIAFAQNLTRKNWSDVDSLFMEHVRPFHGLPGSVVGLVNAREDGFWVGDCSAAPGSSNAIIDHWGSRNKTYVVLCFFEPIDASQMYYGPSSGEPIVDETGALKTPVRPRVVFLIERNFATEVFGNFPDLVSIDWVEQPPLWHNMIVAGHASDDNALKVLANNGLFWANVFRPFLVNNGDNFLTRRYLVEAVSYYLHGALGGSEHCHAQAAELLKELSSPSITLEEIKLALRSRGQHYDTNATRLLESINLG